MTYLKEFAKKEYFYIIECKNMDWIKLAKNLGHLHDILKAVINLRVLLNALNG
jgi:hypothetical protein